VPRWYANMKRSKVSYVNKTPKGRYIYIFMQTLKSVVDIHANVETPTLIKYSFSVFKGAML